MRASPFVPARNSRHRRAALALCRALLRHGARIPLPKDTSPPAGQPNPVQALVIQQFRKNRPDTSPRLVLAALSNGYRVCNLLARHWTIQLTHGLQFLSLFSHARDPKSTSHAEITTYIRQRLQENGGYITKELQPKPPPAPDPPKAQPLLVETVRRNGLSSYARGRSPTPFEQLKEGRRHIPKLFVTSYQNSFLRFTKPQPPILSHMIRCKSDRFQARITKLNELRSAGMDAARDEDKWEDLVERLMSEESKQEPSERNPNEKSFAQTMTESHQNLNTELRRDRLNSIARTQALLRIVDEEKQLAREEAPLRKALAERKRKQVVGKEEV